eukprot:Seg381.28 transcript_id=Seg381.28/GoldUCD/mRNA.D3Y31 product="hypothetical protein" protein_id=Seg381.28/GoldUCD/D3Y31
MDQRRTSGFSLNSKFKNMHQMVTDKKLQKDLVAIEQEFNRDVSRHRKETLAIKQDYFKLKKEKGSLNAQSLHLLELSPGLQDRNTRSRRYGAFDPAMLKARDEEENEPVEDTRTLAEKRKESLAQQYHNQMSTIPDFDSDDTRIEDPYKRSLARILDNSKMAKEARVTALKVKALEAIKPRPANTGAFLANNRRESSDSFSDVVYRRSRILSMPTNSTVTKQPHLLARRSLSDSKTRYDTQHESLARQAKHDNDTMKSIQHESLARQAKRDNDTTKHRARKRSSSLVPPKLAVPIDNHVLRRRSDTPIFSGKVRLTPLEEGPGRCTPIPKLPDVVNND